MNNTNKLNLYGDEKKFKSPGHGADIATQRADDLDNMAIDFSKSYMQVLDIACGQGGQTIRMAKKKCYVLGIDKEDFSDDILELAKKEKCHKKVSFLQVDIQKDFLLEKTDYYDIVIFQRAIHYFSYQTALKIMNNIHRLMKHKSRLYISASGINSELGDNYREAPNIIEERYKPITKIMQEKHNIYGNICLYNETDIKKLANDSQFIPLKIFSSPFGNIKAILEKKI